MKTVLKRLLCVASFITMTLLFSIAASAVPAASVVSAGSPECQSVPGPLLTLSDIRQTTARRKGGMMRAHKIDPAVCDIPLVMIVVGFEDQPYRDDFDWAEPVFRAEKSVASYYTDMSFGKFTFTPAAESSAGGVGGNTNTADAENDGVIHVTLPLPHDDWTLHYNDADLRRQANRSLAEALAAAVEAADPWVDFAGYDVNGDGAITTDELAIAFVIAGYEASSSWNYSLGRPYYLWAHCYSFQEEKRKWGCPDELPAPDGVTVDTFVAVSEQEENGAMEPIGVLAHELGHFLGLPDLYDTEYSSGLEWSAYSVSSLSLMANGARNGDPRSDENIPCSLDAWSRYVLGWTEPEAVGASGEYTLTAQHEANGAAYRLLRINTQNPGEYYLLENRSLDKWDAGLSYLYGRHVGGIILWHIDSYIVNTFWVLNRVNNGIHRPGVMPLYAESADGVYSFIGRNESVNIRSAFFDRSVWNEQFAELGPSLDLPVYGADSAHEDNRDGRMLSGIRLTFLSDGAPSMQVRVDTQIHLHTPVYTVLVAPTCTECGAAGYQCTGCGKLFADPDAYRELTEPFLLYSLGHTEPDADGRCSRCHVLLNGDEEKETCPYCHLPHTGAFGGLVAFFHKLLYFFAHLFGRM